MTDDNKRNLQYFEADSMAGLFKAMQEWQQEKEIRFLSMNVQSDSGRFCCIALTNPSEVIIVDGTALGHKNPAKVDKDHRLYVNAGG